MPNRPSRPAYDGYRCVSCALPLTRADRGFRQWQRIASRDVPVAQLPSWVRCPYEYGGYWWGAVCHSCRAADRLARRIEKLDWWLQAHPGQFPYFGIFFSDSETDDEPPGDAGGGGDASAAGAQSSGDGAWGPWSW